MKTFWKVVLVLLIFLVVQSLIGIIYGIFLVLHLITTNAFSLQTFMNMLLDATFILTIFADIAVLLIYYFMFKKENRNLLLEINMHKFPVIKVLLGLIVGVSLWFMSNLIVTLLSYLIPSVLQEYIEQFAFLSGTNILVMIFAVSIIAPLFEEIMCRGIIMNYMDNKLKLIWIILIQALIFGAIHMNIIQGTFAFVIGIVLGLAYYYTKSIWVPIAIHFAHNTFDVIISYTGLGELLLSNNAVNLTITLSLNLIVVPFIIFMYYLKREKMLPENPDLSELSSEQIVL